MYLKHVISVAEKYEELEDISLEKTLELSGADVIIIASKTGGYNLISYKKIILNNNVWSGAIKLCNNMVIRVKEKEWFIFKDDVKQQAYPIDCNTLEANLLETEKETCFNEFWKNGLHADSLESLATRLLYYAQHICKFNRRIFYTIDDNLQGHYLYAFREDNLSDFKTPESILFKAYRLKKGYLFKADNVKNPSLSIVRAEVKEAFCFPFVTAKNKIPAIVYLDSIQAIEHRTAAILNHICRKINEVIISLCIREETLLDPPEELKEIVL